MQAIARLAHKLICSWGLKHLPKKLGIPQDGITMNQRDGFTGGFIAGTIVGSVVGGVIGALLASGRATELALEAESRRNNNLSEGNNIKRQRRLRAANSDQSIEIARRSLEDKIAQLNETIDEVRMTLGEVNGNQLGENPERKERREELR